MARHDCRSAPAKGAGKVAGAGEFVIASYGKPRERGAVDLDAQARALRDLDPATVLLDRHGQDRHADRMLGAVEFEERFDGVETRRVVRQSGDQLQ